MSYDNNFGGVIWTNHALDRLNQRRLDQQIVYSAFMHPDKSFPGKKSGTTEYQKRLGKSLVTIIASKTDKGEWLILSCWVNPPLQGSVDIEKKKNYLAYKKASFWGKIWKDLKYLMGI